MSQPVNIRQGSRGPQVRQLQVLLNRHGAALKEDGIFGPLTRSAVEAFQRANGLIVDGVVGGQTWDALTGAKAAWPNDIVKVEGREIRLLPIDSNQYIEAWSRKTQIVLHHTAGGPDPEGVARWWNTDPSRVATAFIIGGAGKSDGRIVQVFDDRSWAWHLGSDRGGDHLAIGIELCNWGFLRPAPDGRFVNHVGGFVPASQVVELERPWRGFRFFHAYTSAQIEATCALVKALADRWGIRIQRQFALDWFDINEAARAGAVGLWNHANFRRDKTDLSPQPALIDALNNIS